MINPTNLNAYLTERGYDVTKPETIPTSVLKKTTLDTAEKMLKAGLSPRIVNIRLESMGKQKIQRLLPTAQYMSGYFSDTITVASTTYGIIADRSPDQVQLGRAVKTLPTMKKTVNFKGTGQLSPTPKPTPQVQTMFVPMIQHQATEPIGNPTLPINVNTAVNTKGIGGLPPTVKETTARIISNINEAEKINPTLPLLAGLFIFGM